MMKEFTIWQRLVTDRTFQWSAKKSRWSSWSLIRNRRQHVTGTLFVPSCKPTPRYCFLLQINSWTFFKGVNVVEYCKCEGFSKCSTSWDPYDGKSITQAQSDQYKVGTRIEAFIDTQQLQNVGIFFIKGGIPSMSIYQVILSCQNIFYNDGREVFWDLVLGTFISGENSRKTGKCGIFSHFLKFQNSNKKVKT